MSGQPEMMSALVRYLAEREQQRADSVAAVVGAMNPRERKLVREAAVMGFVRGVLAGEVGGREGPFKTLIPPDSDIVRDVVSACLAMSDRYPTFSRLERTAARRAAESTKGGTDG